MPAGSRDDATLNFKISYKIISSVNLQAHGLESTLADVPFHEKPFLSFALLHRESPISTWQKKDIQANALDEIPPDAMLNPNSLEKHNVPSKPQVHSTIQNQ